MVKGFTDRDKKFHPISDYKKVRKSSGKTIQATGIKIRKQRMIPLFQAKRMKVEKILEKVFGAPVEFHGTNFQTPDRTTWFTNVKAVTPQLQARWAEHFPSGSFFSISKLPSPNTLDPKSLNITIEVSDADFNEITKNLTAEERRKRKTFTSTSGQLLVLKGVEQRAELKQSTIDVLVNLKRPKGLPTTIGFKNIRDGVGEWTFFADGRYPFTRNGEIDAGRARNAVARGSQQGVIDQLKRRGLCKVLELAGIKMSTICTGLEG